jgi:hypothetical protein
MKEYIVKTMKRDKNKSPFNLRASTIMLVLFILTGVMIVVFGGASVIISGLKMGTLQSHSTKAYFAAESGTERLLYEFRSSMDFWEKIKEEGPPQENLFGTTTLAIGAEYIVNYNSYNPLTFTGIGSYAQTRRSVEVNFYD